MMSLSKLCSEISEVNVPFRSTFLDRSEKTLVISPSLVIRQNDCCPCDILEEIVLSRPSCNHSPVR